MRTPTWWLHNLPQYTSLTRPIIYKESHLFCNLCPCANDIVYAGFQDSRIFLYVVRDVVKLFVRKELWIYIPLTLFYSGGLAGCSNDFFVFIN